MEGEKERLESISREWKSAMGVGVGVGVGVTVETAETSGGTVLATLGIAERSPRSLYVHEDWISRDLWSILRRKTGRRNVGRAS